MYSLNDFKIHNTINIENGIEEDFAVLGGFAEIAKDTVSVFAEGATLAKEVDEEAERQKIAQAKASLSSQDPDINMELAEMEIKKSLLMLKVKNRTSKH
jgi:F-type H+-transporting ATPase subunit epsilon